MEIAFKLTGRHAEWLIDLYALTQESATGPRFTGPSDLVRSLIEALLDDDARENAAGYANLLH